MINLNSNILIRISAVYINKMLNIIEQRYKQEVSIKPIQANPFTNQPYTKLFENGRAQGMDLKLAEELLTKPMDYICQNYAQINYYILTCKLVYFSRFKVDNELNRLNRKINQKERNNFREEFVSRYMNPWIRPILATHLNFSSSNDNFIALIKDVERRLNCLNNAIANIVDYDLLSSELRHLVLTGTGVEVCPYCNRQYITPYQKGTKIKSTADIDHFFPKFIFQLLSLSLFNFVPSCQICNSRFKLARSLEILYPYNDGFINKAVFEVKLNSKSTLESITGKNTTFDLTINISPTCSNKLEVENSIKLFNLREVYQCHKDYVREILYKKHAYSDTYKGQLKQLFSDMNLGLTEVNLFLYGKDLNPGHLGKRPLSKLTYDIINFTKI
jgi:hypothetical protein